MSVTQEWLGRKEQRPDGSIAEIPLKWAVLAPNVESQLAKDARSILPSGSKVVVGHDKATQSLAEPVIRALHDQGIATLGYEVPCAEGEEQPVATDAQVELLEGVMEKEDIALGIAVGSGTVTDIIKAASFGRSIHWLSYGTAASMNGYTSAIAALYVGGLKSTVPVRAALGVYADPEVVAKAPLELQLAGFGDLCSKPFAGADAAIAAILSGQEIWDLPTAMVDSVFSRVLESAAALGSGNPAATEELMDALWVSGLSMTVAGNSAPASGGEHLWSHRLDMARHDQGLPPQSFHGTQVGVACGLVRPLFGAAAELDSGAVRMKIASPCTEPDPEDEAFTRWIQERHPDLSESSRIKVEAEARLKYERRARLERREALVTHWPRVRLEVQKAYEHAQRIDQGLKDSHAARLPEDIGVSTEESDRILSVCRDIRNRHTILDLADDLLSA
jgi:glycerol-1-phosphate dehydrogenase [NAD(P)+]